MIGSLVACGSNPEAEETAILESLGGGHAIRGEIARCLHHFRPGKHQRDCLCLATHDRRWCGHDAGAAPDGRPCRDGAPPPDGAGDATTDASLPPDGAADGADAGTPSDAGQSGSDTGGGPVSCGDGVIGPAETCDPPDDAVCDRSCQSIPIACGDGIVQPGEICEFTNTQLCRNCALTNCGGCFITVGGGAGVCSGLSAADQPACNRLVGCTTQNVGFCAAAFGALGCYCVDPTCSAGAHAPCVAQFEALGHSTDLAVIRAQINDPSTPVGKVAAAVTRFAHSACGAPCTLQNN